MTLPAVSWPSCLPNPSSDSFTLTQNDRNVSRVAGPAFARLRSGRDYAEVGFRFVMSELQFGIFQSWWHNTIYDGAGWWSATFISGRTHQFRFQEGYEATLQARGSWEVTAKAIANYRAA